MYFTSLVHHLWFLSALLICNCVIESVSELVKNCCFGCGTCGVTITFSCVHRAERDNDIGLLDDSWKISPYPFLRKNGVDFLPPNPSQLVEYQVVKFGFDIKSQMA